jgi:hypothetical protein
MPERVQTRRECTVAELEEWVKDIAVDEVYASNPSIDPQVSLVVGRSAPPCLGCGGPIRLDSDGLDDVLTVNTQAKTARFCPCGCVLEVTDMPEEWRVVGFLRARLDEDEQRAHEAFSGQADPENGWGADRPEWQRHTTITPHVGMIHEAVQADHVVRWDPARVLREVEAKRRLLDGLLALPHYAWDGRAEYGCPKFEDAETWAAVMGDAEQRCTCGRDDHVERMLRIFARPYSGYPDYNEDCSA